MDVAPGTVVVFSDLLCPWAHLSVYRLHAARDRAGLRDVVVIDHRAFPLEVVNSRPTPFRVLSAEIPVVAALDRDAGWQVWQADPTQWPVTSLLALEAVQAAKEQGLRASESLDRALRIAIFGASQCISMRHVILDVAGATEGVDPDALANAIDSGRTRRRMLEQHHNDDVRGSPHVFLPDGSAIHNPGVTMHWEGDHGRGFPVVERDDASVYDTIMRRAAAAIPSVR